MEEVVECLMITGIEISCWKEQLEQVVSQPLILFLFMRFDQFLLVTSANQIWDLIKKFSIYRGLQRLFLHLYKPVQFCSKSIKEGQYKNHLYPQSIENKFYVETWKICYKNLIMILTTMVIPYFILFTFSMYRIKMYWITPSNQASSSLCWLIS